MNHENSTINLNKYFKYKKQHFFHSLAFQDQMPLCLPKFEINNISIKREKIMKLLCALLDNNMGYTNPCNDPQ